MFLSLLFGATLAFAQSDYQISSEFNDIQIAACRTHFSVLKMSLGRLRIYARPKPSDRLLKPIAEVKLSAKGLGVVADPKGYRVVTVDKSGNIEVVRVGFCGSILARNRVANSVLLPFDIRETTAWLVPGDAIEIRMQLPGGEHYLLRYVGIDRRFQLMDVPWRRKDFAEAVSGTSVVVDVTHNPNSTPNPLLMWETREMGVGNKSTARHRYTVPYDWANRHDAFFIASCMDEGDGRLPMLFWHDKRSGWQIGWMKYGLNRDIKLRLTSLTEYRLAMYFHSPLLLVGKDRAVLVKLDGRVVQQPLFP